MRDHSLVDIALALGVSDSLARRYARRFGVPFDGTARRRRFDLDEFRRILVEGGVGHSLASRAHKVNLGGITDAAGVGPAFAEAKRLLTIQRVRALEIGNDVRQGILVDLDDCRRRWTMQALAFRTALEAVPTKATSAILAALQLPASSRQVVFDVISAEVRDAMRRLSS